MNWMLISIFSGHVLFHSHYKTLDQCVKHIPKNNTPVVNLLYSGPNYMCRLSNYEGKHVVKSKLKKK